MVLHIAKEILVKFDKKKFNTEKEKSNYTNKCNQLIITYIH